MVFLLDEHLSSEVAGLCPARRAVALRDWRGGVLLGQSDHRLLEEAARDGLVFVTFDLATIPTLLQEMAAAGRNHAGVVFISSRSFAQNDHAAIASALNELHLAHQTDDWTNRVVFLRKPAVRLATKPELRAGT
jgi:hypothetical protein